MAPTLCIFVHKAGANYPYLLVKPVSEGGLEPPSHSLRVSVKPPLTCGYGYVGVRPWGLSDVALCTWCTGSGLDLY